MVKNTQVKTYLS